MIEGYNEHITPTSATDDEKNHIIEMCRQTMNAYGANVNVTDIKKKNELYGKRKY